MSIFGLLPYLLLTEALEIAGLIVSVVALMGAFTLITIKIANSKD